MLTLFSFVFLLLSINAQTTPKASSEVMEIGVMDYELVDQLMVTVAGVGSRARELLTQQSVKPYLMPARKIGFRGTEMSYVLASCLEYYVNLERNYKVNLSPDYISLSLTNAGKTVTPEDAFRFLVEDGTVSAAILPYDAAALTNAVYATQKYKINNFLYLFRDVTKGRQKAYETRKALMRGNPVVVLMQADDSLRMVTDSRFWKPEGAGTKLYPLLIVGYDEEEEAFEAMSCWGRQWGDSGYVMIKYHDFENHAVDGFVMVPENNY